MRLRSFSVSGYKNIRQPLELTDLAPITLIHGANNIGKSNLLQAMELFFRCLAPPSGHLGFGNGRPLAPEEHQGLVAHSRELFHLERPLPIVLRGSFEVPQNEIDAADVQKSFPSTEVEVAFRIEWNLNSPLVRLEKLHFGTEAGAAKPPEADVKHSEQAPKFLAMNPFIQEGPARRFAIVGVHRDLENDPVDRRADSVPLSVEMYDCRESQNITRRNRWRAFVRVMESFKDVTDDAVFEVTFPRSAPFPRLMLDTDDRRTPFRLLGTGVQQAAAVLGNLLMRNASIVAIEEPELNLRWDLQDRLRQALIKLVSEPHAPGGLDQIFLTSHSPAFETGDTFWLMEKGSDGPVLSRRPSSELRFVLGSAPQHLGLPERVPQAYVTSQGVVKLPPQAIERLGVSRGGGVVVTDLEPRGIRVLSNDDYLDELGLAEEPEGTDAPA
jgi:hypothetical protein